MINVQKLLLFIALIWGLAFNAAVQAEDEEEIPPESIYVAIEPTFVTNYGGPGRLRYMSVEVSLRVLGPEGEASVQRHMPNIKDTLLNLFAIQTTATISDAEGKETLRLESLKQVGDMLAQEGDEGLLEDLLFTGFVVYR